MLVRIVPPALINCVTSASASCAVRVTLPPSARITPLLVTSAGTSLPPTSTARTACVTSSEISLSPYKSSVNALAPASATWPSCAVITPLFSTCGATSPTSPACRAVNCPSLMIFAPGFGVPENTMRPAMKSLVATLEVETKMLSAFTCEPLVNTTPD